MKSPTTGPWESRPIGSKGDIGIYVLNATPSCGVIARIPYTDTKPVQENARLIAAAPDLLIENTARRHELKAVGGEDAA